MPDPFPAIEVLPATADRWADIATLLGANGDKGCWCQAPGERAVGYGTAEHGFRRVLQTAAHSDRRPRILMRLDFEPVTEPAAR